ncbi:MAG: Fis family transcriptional regulator, partial [Desulfuromusa sp.]|nr:Fis family transcriptional regulator [Desulfuromusa sp.]
RELMNICERLVVMAETELIDLPDLPIQVTSNTQEKQFPIDRIPSGTSLQQTLDQVEKNLLKKALQQFDNQTEIAVALDVNQSTIARKLKKHGLS